MSSTVNHPASPSYHLKLKTKVLSPSPTRHRFGTNKLREKLRQQCRVRVQETRRSSFDKNRQAYTSDDKSILVADILREELAQLENDINLQNSIYKELLDEMNEWFMKQLEEEENYLISVYDSDDLFCPICLKSTLLSKDGTTIICSCGVFFYFNGNIEKLRSAFQQKLKTHDINCDEPLEFFIEPKSPYENFLSAMCEHCDYFCSF